MGATDNSFIKAFDQDNSEPQSQSQPRRGRDVLPGVYVDQSPSITVTTPALSMTETGREQAVSHLYAAADRIRARRTTIRTVAAAKANPANFPGVRIDGADPVLPPAPYLSPQSYADAAPNIPTPAESTPIPAPLTTDSPVITTPIPEPTQNEITYDEPVETEDTEDTTEDEASTEDHTATEDIETSDAETVWKPQWEVDAVVWPEIVEQLTDQWAGELSSLIRPLLTSAWQGENVIAVTSFNRGEGATTMAMCLARMAASFRVPVAIMDGDLVEPKISERLGMAFGQGWNTLPSALPLSEAAISANDDQIVVVPGSRHFGLGNESTTAFHALQELSNNFELVILDAGPIFTAAHRWFDGPAAECIHGTLIVQDVRATTGIQIEDVCSRLGGIGMEQVAIVENFRRAA